MPGDGSTNLTGITLDIDMTIENLTVPWGGIGYVREGLTIAEGRQLRLDSGTGLLFLDGSQTVGGAGEILIGLYTLDGMRIDAGTLTIGSGLTVRTDGGDATIGESGFVAGNANVINNGTLVADLQDVILHGEEVTNNGTLVARNRGTVTVVHAGSWTNVVNGVLTGGRWEAYENSRIRLRATATENAADVFLSGPASGLIGLANKLNRNSGSFTITNGRELTTQAHFDNVGQFAIGSASTFTVTTDFTQSSAGVFDVTLGSIGQGLLDVLGQASLDGTLALQFEPAFDPEFGDVFTILSAATRLGMFSGYQNLSISPEDSLRPIYTATGVDLEVYRTGDVNGDGETNMTDLAMIAAGWGGPGDFTTGDLNGDGILNVGDFAMAAYGWTNGTGGGSTSVTVSGAATIPAPSIFPGGLALLGVLSLKRNR